VQVGQLRTLLADAQEDDEVEVFVPGGDLEPGTYYTVARASQVSGWGSPGMWCINTGEVIGTSD
jgi:hypothetical protein